MRTRRARGRGKGRRLLPRWKGFQPYRCFFTRSERGSDLLGCLCSPRLVSGTRRAVRAGSLLLFKRLLERQRSCAPSRSRPGPAGDRRGGQSPPWAANHRRERQRCRRTSTGTGHVTGGLHGLRNTSGLLVSLPTPKSQTALPAKLGARAPSHTLHTSSQIPGKQLLRSTVSKNGLSHNVDPSISNQLLAIELGTRGSFPLAIAPPWTPFHSRGQGDKGPKSTKVSAPIQPLAVLIGF